MSHVSILERDLRELTSDVALFDTSHETIAVAGFSVTCVLYVASSVVLVHGECHTVLVGHARLFTFVNVFILGDKRTKISSIEIDIVSDTTCEKTSLKD